VDEFFIQTDETTRGAYEACVVDGVCSPLANADPFEVPVRDVTWDQARMFCEWQGGNGVRGRLPTEAEWERVARGTSGLSYAWGESYALGDVPPDPSWACPDEFNVRVNYGACGLGEPGLRGGPVDVTTLGVYNMAGNVSEWVADFYDAGYYAVAPDMNPPGPESGDARVMRGGSYDDPGDLLRTWIRRPGQAGPSLGFRCAVDVDAPCKYNPDAGL
jgi:formylglycine-generating enzyme required for sulfatase activity